MVGFFILVSLPKVYRALRSGLAFKDARGLLEKWNQAPYQALSSRKSKPRRPNRVGALVDKLSCWIWFSLPVLGLNVGQGKSTIRRSCLSTHLSAVLLLGGYTALVISCIVVDAALVKNANRAGRIALAQLPVVFLFATKNSILSLLLGPGRGYEKLNFVHKWAGRGIFLGSVIHGALWIKDHLTNFTPLLGQSKEETGMAAFGLLCVLVLASLLPIRRWCYNVFYLLQ